MSNLPHPLGDSSAGDLFYPGSPSVIVSDTPGVAGSRAVEFGEDGLSSVVNRMGYALGKNEEYIQARMEAKIAKPQFTSFTPAGGNGDSFTFTGVDLFVGAADYTPESQDIRNSLIGLIDANYNEVIDSFGNKVVVKEIKNTGDTASVVGTAGGFYAAGAIVRFKTVNPITGVDVLGSYTLPDGTQVYLVHGISVTLDTLDTGGSEHLMRDSWFKGFTRSISEVQAATFLKDGSRKMKGDIDLDDYNLNNVREIHSASATQLDIISDDVLQFQDAGLSGLILLNDGETDIYHPNTVAYNDAILNAINSNTHVSETYHENRPLNRTGSFTSNPGGPSITYPNLDLVMNGQQIQIITGTHTVTGTGTFFLYVDAVDLQVKQVVSTSVETIAFGSVLIYSFAWNGAAFADEVDLRWPAGRKGNALTFYVGDSVGEDFSDLVQACTMAALYAENHKFSGKILLFGSVTVDSAFQVPAGWSLRGIDLPSEYATINTSTTFSTTSTVATLGVGSTIKNLRFRWANSSANQGAAYGGIETSNGAVVQNVSFSNVGSYLFGNCVIGSDGDRGISIQDCLFDECFDNAAVLGKGGEYWLIEGCEVAGTDAADYWFDLSSAASAGKHNTIRRCHGDSVAPVTAIVEMGPRGLIEACDFEVSGSNTPTMIQIDNGFVGLTEGGADILHSRFVGGFKGVRSIGGTASLKALVNVIGNRFYGFGDTIFDLNHTALDNESSFTIKDNLIDGITGVGYILYVNYCKQVSFAGNRVFNNAANGVRVLADSRSIIDGNYLHGWGTTINSLITIDVGAYGTKIINNHLLSEGAVASCGAQITSEANNVLIANNYLSGDNANVQVGIYGLGSDNRVFNNHFRYHTQSHIRLSEGGNGLVIAKNIFSQGINKTETVGAGTEVTAMSIYASDASNVNIEGNIFKDFDGRAIVISATGSFVVQGNVFESVAGRFGYDSGGLKRDKCAVIYVIEPVVIDGNFICDCGYSYGATQTPEYETAGIFIDASGCVVNNNKIKNMVGSADAGIGDVTAGIRVGSFGGDVHGGVISNNHISEDGATGAKTSYGILVYGDTWSITANQIFMTGTFVGQADGLYLDTSRSVIALNSIMGAVTGTAYAVAVITGNTRNVLIGNLSQNYDMLFSGSSHMQMGNLITNAGATLSLNGYPTNTTYNVNSASNPLDDFNRKI